MPQNAELSTLDKKERRKLQNRINQQNSKKRKDKTIEELEALGDERTPTQSCILDGLKEQKSNRSRNATRITRNRRWDSYKGNVKGPVNNKSSVDSRMQFSGGSGSQHGVYDRAAENLDCVLDVGMEGHSGNEVPVFSSNDHQSTEDYSLAPLGQLPDVQNYNDIQTYGDSFSAHPLFIEGQNGDLLSWDESEQRYK